MSNFTSELHPRNLIGQFTGVSGNDKRLKKIRKTRAKLDKAQSDFVATASVRTVGGGRRPLTKKEARRFLNETNVHANIVQGHTRSRRGAAKKVLQARTTHLANFGRKPRPPAAIRNAGRKLK